MFSSLVSTHIDASVSFVNDSRKNVNMDLNGSWSPFSNIFGSTQYFVICKLQNVAKYKFFVLFFGAQIFICAILYASVSASWEKFPNNRAFFQGVPEGFCSRMHAGNILESFWCSDITIKVAWMYTLSSVIVQCARSQLIIGLWPRLIFLSPTRQIYEHCRRLASNRWTVHLVDSCFILLSGWKSNCFQFSR